MDFCKDDKWYQPGQEVKGALPTRPSLIVIFTATSCRKAKRTPFVELPPEIRNKIYGLVLARPTTTVVELDKDWKQPALSLTCHQIQSEMLSFWLGHYKCSFWPNRYGMEYSLSPLMRKWMTRAGKDAAKIRHLEINVRMPDYSRFSWQVKISNHGKLFVMSEVSLPEGIDRDNPLEPPMAAAPEASAQTSQSTGLARPKSSHWVAEPRNFQNEFPLMDEIFDRLKYDTSLQSTTFLGLPEIEEILEIFNECGLVVPENLDAQNPSWTEELGGSYRIPKANAPQQASTRWAPVPWLVEHGSLLDSVDTITESPAHDDREDSMPSKIGQSHADRTERGRSEARPSLPQLLSGQIQAAVSPISQAALDRRVGEYDLESDESDGSGSESTSPAPSPEVHQRCPLQSSGAASLATSIDSEVIEYRSAGQTSVKRATMPTITESDFCQAMQNLFLTKWTMPMH